MIEVEARPLEKKSASPIPPEWGEKTTLSSLIGKTITIYDHRKIGGDDDKLYAYAAILDGAKIWFFSSSGVINNYVGQIPFIAKVIQRSSTRNRGRRYIDFDAP